VRGLVERGSTWAEAERGRVEAELRARRQRSAIIDAGFEMQELDVGVGGGILAGAVAFRLFLFLVPFVYIVFTMIGAAAKTSGEDPAHLAKTIGITGVLASAVVSTADLSAWSQVLLLLGALWALVFAARSLVKTLYVVHWLVWRIPRVKPRGTLPALTLIGMAVMLSVFVTVNNAIRSDNGLAGVVVSVVLITGASSALWWWMSWKLPHDPAAPSYAFLPGAGFGAVGIEVLHLITTYWIGHLVARKSHTYGAVGIALAVLLWVYILGRIIVGSAGLNATLWRRHQSRHGEGGATAHG